MYRWFYFKRKKIIIFVLLKIFLFLSSLLLFMVQFSSTFFNLRNLHSTNVFIIFVAFSNTRKLIDSSFKALMYFPNIMELLFCAICFSFMNYALFNFLRVIISFLIHTGIYLTCNSNLKVIRYLFDELTVNLGKL